MHGATTECFRDPQHNTPDDRGAGWAHYTLDASRGNAVAIRLLEDYAGTVIVDGYRPYEVAQPANPNILLGR